jgi:ariadne-1
MDVDEPISSSEDETSSPQLRRYPFSIISQGQISQKIERLMSDYSELLGLSSDETLLVMTHYKWKSHKLQDDWMDNELKVRVQCGISPATEGFDYALSRGVKVGSVKLVSGTEGCCQICLVDCVERDALQCQHTFCKACWRGYFDESVKASVSHAVLSCPMYSCTLKVPESMVLKYLDPQLEAAYYKNKCETFVNLSQGYRWCPAPNCQYIAEFPNLGSHEIKCKCGCYFCFACASEAHRPASCQIVKEWMLKNSAESENVTWILANTKQCPSCKKPIEKNQGCNHMSCRVEIGGCKHEFCWMCLGPWSEHNSATGGYYRCNKYEDDVSHENSSTRVDERQREEAKHELDRYMFYFERYNNHNKAQGLAARQVPDIDSKMQLLHDVKNYGIGELEFLKEAAEQVVVNRRVLKWTYAFGFYLSAGQEKNLFEHLQEKLEENTEHLHEMVEKPLDPYLKAPSADRAPFYAFKSDLVNYYQVTKRVSSRQFLHNLLDGIENGLTGY